MVLCDTEIRAAISSGQIIIDPPPPADHITTTAVDLTLGAEFRRWITPEGGIDFAIDPSHLSFNYHKVASKYQESVQLEADGSVVLVQRKSEFWPAVLSWLSGVVTTNVWEG
jgi:deoxycytidine triphosphate deaminase